MGNKLTDSFNNELKRGRDNLELSLQDDIVIKPIDLGIEKRYRELKLNDYKKKHPVKGFLKWVYYKLKFPIY